MYTHVKWPFENEDNIETEPIIDVAYW